MSKPDLPERVTKLEQQMTEVSRKTDDTAHLAREADKDVADFRIELRTQRKLIVALRETQVEQGTEIREMREEMREGLSKVGVGMAHITALLTIALDGSGKPPS